MVTDLTRTKMCALAQFFPVITLLVTIFVALAGRHIGIWKFDLVDNPRGWVRDL